MTVRSMRFARWITKATNTHSEYVILIAFPLQQWLQKCASKLRSYLRCLSSYMRICRLILIIRGVIILWNGKSVVRKWNVIRLRKIRHLPTHFHGHPQGRVKNCWLQLVLTVLQYDSFDEELWIMHITSFCLSLLTKFLRVDTDKWARAHHHIYIYIYIYIWCLCAEYKIYHFKTKRRPLYLKTQSVPRCKHFSSRL